jgi:hypothetical protein
MAVERKITTSYLAKLAGVDAYTMREYVKALRTLVRNSDLFGFKNPKAR